MLRLEILKVMLELVVPRVQDKDLKPKGRGGDAEVGQRDEACDRRHCDGCWEVLEDGSTWMESAITRARQGRRRAYRDLIR